MTVRTARIIGVLASPTLILSLLAVLEAVFDTEWETLALPLWIVHFLLAIPVIPFAGHGWFTLAAEIVFWSAAFGVSFGEFAHRRSSGGRR